MRAVIQRVTEASVRVDGTVTGAIGHGFLILLGVTHADGEPQCKALAKKTAHMRIFRDNDGKMNLALADVGGKALVVSQFTLYADCRRGNRPGFTEAAAPEQADTLYEMFCAELVQFGIEVQKGIFGASMNVSLVNDGPVTIILDTDDLSI